MNDLSKITVWKYGYKSVHINYVFLRATAFRDILQTIILLDFLLHGYT